jgi:hypothetical protein
MNTRRFYKAGLCLLAVLLLVVASLSQARLNRDREKLGLTRLTPLENAPPILAFTTVALGGFRGLIANALWIRATELQDDGKYFEMVQLADWITKLQPHFVTVWIHQAWNMAYNISVKFSDPRDRWLWVQRGIELMRDEGLRYNPQETLLYREIAWFFQHKMGADLDDAHWLYKREWAQEMAPLFPKGRPDYDAWANPADDAARQRVKRLRERYKLDPAYIRKADEIYGPLDWRMPESHALYWGVLGLERASKEQLITLRRIVYHSMQMAFHRGRYIENKATGVLTGVGPNLEIVEKTNRAYEDMMAEDAEMRDHIKTGHRNFLKTAVYFLYTHNRLSEAAKWFAYIRQLYPEALKPDLTLDAYAIDMVTTDVSETSHVRVKQALEGLLETSLYNLAIGQDDQALGLNTLAFKVWQRFQEATSGSKERVGMPEFKQLQQEAQARLLDPEEGGLEPLLIAQLRTALGLPAAEAPPSNAPPGSEPAPKP